jgi:hypothetical protein
VTRRANHRPALVGFRRRESPQHDRENSSLAFLATLHAVAIPVVPHHALAITSSSPTKYTGLSRINHDANRRVSLGSQVPQHLRKLTDFRQERR